jgi:hypothetical protein
MGRTQRTISQIQPRFLTITDTHIPVPRGQFAKAACTALKAECKINNEFTEDKLYDSEAILKRLPWLCKWNDNMNEQALADIRSKGKLKGWLQREARGLTQIVSSSHCVSGIAETDFPRSQGSYTILTRSTAGVM